jgi:hypothetical protein
MGYSTRTDMGYEIIKTQNMKHHSQCNKIGVQDLLEIRL